MAGISGAFGDGIDASHVRDMTRALRHRGPDGRGSYNQPGVHLGICRLHLADAADDEQPLANERGDKAIVLNGEIYNRKALRNHLEARGHIFKTGSDAEVVIRLYEEYGERCLDHLQGMFAFAIAHRDRIFLARDRLGIKPLYYALSAGGAGIFFASEIKGILQHHDASLSEMAISDLAFFGGAVGNRTMFRDVFALRPGHFMTIKRGSHGLELDERRYYKVEVLPKQEFGFSEACDRIDELLRSAVQSQRVVDTDAAVLLSGGLDSSLLSVVMNDMGMKSFPAITLADDDEHPDLVYAKQLCSQIGWRHQVLIIDFDQVIECIPGCIAAIERPTRLMGVSFFLLCQHIGRDFKAAYSRTRFRHLVWRRSTVRRPARLRAISAESHGVSPQARRAPPAMKH